MYSDSRPFDASFYGGTALFSRGGLRRTTPFDTAIADF
jgi:hypothetical protein